VALIKEITAPYYRGFCDVLEVVYVKKYAETPIQGLTV
jgi:hypothetical protein